jgi:hypothetical protein
MAWENDGTPFTGTWNSNNVYTVTYSVHAVAVGDLDNDGWLDIVAGVNHAPQVGSPSEPVPPEDWYPNYELRAYRNDGTPFTDAWPQAYVGRDPETETLLRHYHGYWGATVFSVALADLDNDGDVDIASTDHVEGDYQIKIWENDGTPFDGLPEEEHWTWQPTAVWVGVIAPWMNASVFDVATGDVNRDGYVDLITASGESYETVVWENDGRPFGSVITDTTWIRHDLGQNTLEGALSVAVGDFDQDGDLDVAHGSGSYWSPNGDHDVVAWLNQSGSAAETVLSVAPEQLLQGTTDDVLSVSVAHGGISSDHDIELAEWRLLLEETSSDPLTTAEANALIANLYVYLDDGDASWQATDTQVLTVADLSLTDGFQTLSFVDGDPMIQVGPGDDPLVFFVVLQATSDASSHTPNAFSVTFDPDADSIVEDRSTDTSVSIQDTMPISSGLVTLVGPPAQVLIEDQSDSSGSEVLTATLGSGSSLVAYANSRDAAGNFRENVAVTWSLADTSGGVTGTDLSPAGDNRSATFTGHQIGAGRILADHATLADDMTGFITVTLEIAAAPSPTVVGDSGGTVVTATLVNEDLTSVADGTIVTFTTSLGDFAGQATTNRTTASGMATATLTSESAGPATITVTGNTSQGWVDVGFIAGEPYTVTAEADPDSVVANGVATSNISATVVDQYNNPVADGTVVTFTTNLGSFSTVPYTRMTTDGVAEATLTAGTELGMATVTVTATDAVSNAVVQFVAGEPYTLAAEASPGSVVADGLSTSTITATVHDQWSHPVADGTVVTFTTSLGSFPTAPYTRTTVDGTAVAVLTSSTQVGTSIVTATSGVTSDTTEVLLVPGAPATLALTIMPLQSSVDGSIAITATVTDQYDNAVADSTPVTFTTSLDVGSGGFSPEVGYTVNGVATSVLTSTLTGSGELTGATTGDVDDTRIITFTPGALASFGLVGSPTSIVAGDSFPSDVTVTVYDTYGNLKTDYVGPAYFASTDLTATLPFTVSNAYDFTVGDAGQHSFAGSGFVLHTTGTQRITVTDGTVAQASEDITVTPTALGSFQIDAPPGVTSAVPFEITVTAYDTEGNLKTDYAGTVILDSTATSATLPTDDGTGWVNGASLFTPTFSTLGSQILTVTHGAVMQAAAINVGAVVHHFDLQMPVSAVAGEPFAVTITAHDQFNNTVTTFANDVALSTSNGGVITPALVPGTAFVSGVWTGSVTLSQAGDDREVRAESGGASGSATIDVSPSTDQPYELFLPVVLCNH